ncbi:MAG: hypothetical protein IPQ07_28690 [Myxococcales bacterium]|nr:hypothetical protein [Myxococcales bacterium]
MVRSDALPARPWPVAAAGGAPPRPPPPGPPIRGPSSALLAAIALLRASRRELELLLGEERSRQLT